MSDLQDDLVFQMNLVQMLRRAKNEHQQHDVIQLHVATETVSNVRQMIIEFVSRSWLPRTRNIGQEEKIQLAAIWKELAEAVEVENQTLAEKVALQTPADIEYAYKAGEHLSRFTIWACTPTYKFDVHYTKINLAIFYCSPKTGEDSSSDSDSDHTIQYSNRQTVSEKFHAAEEQGRRAARKDEPPVSASDSSISDPADSDPEQHRKSRSHKENVALIRQMVLEDRQTRVAADNTQSVADGSSVSDDHNQSQQLWLSSNKKTTPALDVASEIHKAVKWCLEPSQTPLFHKRVVGTIHWPAKFVKMCTDMQRRLQELRSGSGKYDVVKKDTELGSQRLEAIWTEEVAQRLPALVLVATDLNRLDDVDQRHQDAELHHVCH